MKKKRRLSPTIWIPLGLLLMNGLAWVFVNLGRTELPEFDPVLHPKIAEIQGHWDAGDAIGESFEIEVTNQMAGETATWLIEPRPSIKEIFSHPWVEMDPEGITGGGLFKVGGLRVPVFGRAEVSLVDGRPYPRIVDLGVASTSAPDFVTNALQTQVNEALKLYDQLDIPVEITELELREGRIYLAGVYR